ncbi:uncharacterized protein LOC126204390 [Schistocerca nitens]|uniref:uncharacterized protein LOC126204390 n=1 Tax=Schistocerca nitens TaxID=7011 RepID=UPI002117F5DD|nr:uncharacterized protein LOC126204390 [Schistocerca nitens]
MTGDHGIRGMTEMEDGEEIGGRIHGDIDRQTGKIEDGTEMEEEGKMKMMDEERIGSHWVLDRTITVTMTEGQEDLVRGGFQPRLPTSLPPPGQQQQPSPLPRRQPVPLMPPAQLHPGAPQVVAPAPAVPLQSPPPSELRDVDPSAGPPSQAVAVQPVLQPLSLGTPKESDTAAPCPAPTQQPSTQRQETLPLFVGPDAPSRPVPEAAPVVTGVHTDLGFQSVFPEAPRSQCWGADRGLPPTTVSAPSFPAARAVAWRGVAVAWDYAAVVSSSGSSSNGAAHELTRRRPHRLQLRTRSVTSAAAETAADASAATASARASAELQAKQAA